MTLTLAWSALLAAAALGALLAVSLKQAAGFTDPLWTTVSLGSAAASLLLLSVALQALPASAVFAAWSGAAAVLVALAGPLLLGERLDSERIFWTGLIVLGVLGLRYDVLT
ncbi:MAG: SMR family transporter [Phenylobacterium sp.]|jgi:multidrug transporter EmrE-like cation transporter|uniref:SMR family transporter n=1 Tax=Phenylobacterium sp. TaxID=1871053 RepID=UPI002A2DAB2D|nr:SMR family transporter [Phenylobacterium sp.]MDD3836396.1 SMR family transporter [Phenylobacterium sp.]MDX9998178.1 SMR family transporter [Phenylobacterium sp.]